MFDVYGRRIGWTDEARNMTRKVCGGNRTWAGARTQQVLAGVVRTARQRKLDTADIFTALLRARQPFVPASLQTPT